jgi:hypothetical protein
MSKLHAAERNALPSGDFGVPSKRALPIEDKAHAQKALQLGPRAVKSGSITPSEMAHVRKLVHERYGVGGDSESKERKSGTENAREEKSEM